MDANIWSDDWGEQGEDWSGGGGLAKRLVPSGPFLGASVYEFERGNFMIFHFHHGSEELLVVLRGTPTLRTFDGERLLEEGEVVHFPTGREGAHGLRNETGEPVRFNGMFHPAGSDLTIAEAKRSRISAFGIEYEGKTGLSTSKFSWAA